MHILFCISSLGSGGAERALSDLANYYVNQGHQVSLLTLVSSNTAPFYSVDSRINLVQTNKASKGKSSIFKRLYNISTSLLGIRKTVTNLKIDKIVTFIDLMNVRVLLACLGLNIPIIVSERTDPAYHQVPLKRVSNWLRLRLYPKAFRVIVQTQAAANYFPKDWGNHVTIIPNVVKKPKNNKLDFLRKDKIQHIISVGRLSQEKNHESLIKVFSDWIKKYPHLRLTIYGEGPERKSLEQLISSLSLSEKVSLPGTVKNIQESLLEGDLFVFPSQYEGFPNALCEAMAVGLPVVASDCSGNAEVVRNGLDGILFPVGDMEALTKAVFDCLDNAEKCDYLSKNAVNIVSRYGSEQVYKKWDNVILGNM